MELPNIGHHCALSSCNILDFLPHPCSFCNKEYCLDHRLPYHHQCNTWRDSKDISTCSICQCIVSTPTHSSMQQHIDSECKLNLYTPGFFNSLKMKCQDLNCNRNDVVYSTCGICGGIFCMKHRHHQCISLKEKERNSETERKRSHAKAILNKNFPSKGKLSIGSSSSSSTSPKYSTQLEKKLQLVKLRKKAIGNMSISMENRIYLTVDIPTYSLSPIIAFVDKSWSVGKCIDYFAELGHLDNENNRTQDETKRLHLYFDEKLLDLSSGVGKILENVDKVQLVRGIQ